MHQLLPGIALHISKTLFTLLLLLSGVSVYAQYPVQVSPQIISPYSLKLSDYSSGTSPRIIVTVTNNDFQQPLINVRLRMNITGQGITLRSKDNVFYPIISLTAGVPRSLTLQDMAPYFDLGNLDFQGMTLDKYQRSGRLPDGFYTFCFEAIEINSHQVVSRPGCTMISISLSDPPMLNSPLNNAMINEMDPVNILFSWTPRHLSSPNAAFNTVYDFQLVELLDNGVSPEVAFRSNPPLYQTTTNLTTLNYNAFNPLLFPGRRYGWRVRSRSLDATLESDVFKNNGYSEIYFFTYKEVCPAPSGITASFRYGGLDITWDPPIYKRVDYVIEYRNRSNINAPWINANTQRSYYTINNLQPGTTYEYRIGSTCSYGGMVYWTAISSFNTPVPISTPSITKLKGNVSWAYKASAESADLVDKSLVSTTKNLESEVDGNNDKSAGMKKYPLKNADVSIAGLKGGSYDWVYTSTDDNGDYYFAGSDITTINSIPKKEITVSDRSGDFSIESRPYNGVPEQVILTAQTFELQPSVFISNYKNGNGNVTLEVLIKKSSYDQSDYFKKAGFEAGPVVNYNNDDYIPIVKLTKGNLYKKLLYNRSASENYVIRITVGNQKPRFYPMPAIMQTAGSDGVKKVKIYKKTFEYKLNMIAEGRVTFKNLPRRDVRVEIKIKPEDILSNNTQATFTAVTNAEGLYTISNLPLLKQGAIINYQIIDKTLSADAYTETYTVSTADIIKKDIVLSSATYTIVGRVLSETGKVLSNALVSVEGTSSQTRTSDDGLYAIKVSGKNPVTLQITNDGYQAATVYLRPGAAWDQTTTAQTNTQWKASIENTESVKAVMQQKNLTEATAEIINIGTGSLSTKFDTYFTGLEDSKGVYAQETVKLTATRGRLSVVVKLNNKPVDANIIINELPSQKISSASPLVVLLSSGKVTLTVSPIQGGVAYVPVTAEATIIQNNTTPVIVSVSEGYVLSGVVTEKGTNNKVAAAKIALQGFPHETTTNSAGEYSIIIPKENELRVAVSKKDFDTKNSTLRVAGNIKQNFELDKRALNIADIQTVANFPVQLDKVVSLGNNTYSISGTLTVAANDVFTPGTTDNKLTFKDAKVTAVLNSKNATPQAEILFEEAVLSTNVFGFGIAEMVSDTRLSLRGIPGAAGKVDYTKAAIGSKTLKLKLSSLSSRANFPITFPDAILTYPVVAGKAPAGNFIYVYAAPGIKITGLEASQKFTINISSPDSLDAPLGGLVNLILPKSGATLSSDGMSFKGRLKLPAMPGVKFQSPVLIDAFTIRNDYGIDIKMTVNKTKPLIAKLQKIEAELHMLSLTGLGTTNMGVGFGGAIRLTNSKNKADELIINEMSIAKVSGGVNLRADVAFGSNGFAMKSLVFKTPGNNRIALSYNTANASFTIEVGGKLEYDANRNVGTKPQTSGGASTALKGVFPIEIQSFKLQTKDFNLFLAAKANIKVDLKVVKININKFLVSIGNTGLSLDAMNQYLTSDKPPANVSAGRPDELVDESKLSWAFGIHGGVEFDVKAVEVAAQTSFLIGNINGKIEFRLNEIELEVKCPSLEAKARVKLQFDDRKWGFEGEAKLLLAKKVGFDGSLKFYKIYAGEGVAPGIELGASFKVYAPVDILEVFTFYSGGGGFNLNTSEQKYEVFLNCSFFPGPPQPVIQIKDAQLKVLFDLNACSGIPIPIIEGTGFLNIASQDWGKVTAVLDVCKKIVMMKVEVDKELAPGVNMKVLGQMLGMVQKVDGKLSPAAYISVAGQANVGDIIKGNVDLRMGINYNNSAPDIPQETYASAFWIPDFMWDGKVLNGIYLSGFINVPRQEGGFDFGISSLNVDFDYLFYANAYAKAYYKFSNKLFGIEADINARANASVNISGAKASGEGNADVTLKGGRDYSWYLNGNADMSLSVSMGSGAGCNSVNASWYQSGCTEVPFPCGMQMCSKWGVSYPCPKMCSQRTCLINIPYGISFKICKGLKAYFDYRQGQSPKYSFSLN